MSAARASDEPVVSLSPEERAELAPIYSERLALGGGELWDGLVGCAGHRRSSLAVDAIRATRYPLGRASRRRVGRS